MNTQKWSAIVLLLGLGLTGNGMAANNTIYQRDAEQGAVELTNLATDEDAQVVSEPAAMASTVVPTQEENGGALTRGVVAESGVGSPAATVQQAREEAFGNAYPNPASRYDPNAGNQGAARSVQSSAGSAIAASSGVGAGDSSATAANGTTGAAAPVFGSGAPPTSTAAAPATAPDSPEALAARWAHYRDIMLNEPLGPNGLAQNPAVQRRYLMVNRYSYPGAK